MNPPTPTSARSRLACVLLVVAASAAATRVSFAQPRPAPAAPPTGTTARPSTPYDDEKPVDPTVRARQRYNDGVGFAKLHDWARAYHAFLDAWKLLKNVAIALNLGRAELETERYRDAVQHLQYCLDNTKPDDGNAVLAQDWIVEARKKAAKVVVVVIDAPHAEVFLDTEPVGSAPLRLPLIVDPGSHVIEARLAERRAQRGVVAEAGSTMTVEIRVPPAADAPQPSGTPSSLPPAPAPPTFFTTRNVVLLSGLAGTLAGTAIGIAWGVQAVLQKDFAVGYCTQFRDPIGPDCWRRYDSNRTNLALTSFGGFLVGGVLALSTGAYWLWGPPAASTAMHVAPVVSTSGGSLVFTGNW